MTISFVVSILLQIGAVFVALRLFYRSKRKPAWALLGAAATATGFVWGSHLLSKPRQQPEILTTLIILASSFLIALALIRISRGSSDQSEIVKELARTNRALTALSKCNECLVRIQDEDELMYEICRVIVEVGGYQLAWVGRAEDDPEKTVRAVAQFGFEEGYLESIGITWDDKPSGRGPTGSAIRSGRPSIAQNILTDPRFRPWRKAALERGYESSIALPLSKNGEVFGALNIYSKEARAFDDPEVSLLDELAKDLAYGLSSLQARRERDQVEKQYRQLLQTAPDGIVVSNAEGNIVLVNEKFCETFGYCEDELIDQPVEFLLPERYRDRHVGHRRRFYQDPHPSQMGKQNNLIGRRKGGAEFPLEISLSHQDSGGGILVTSIVHDISERRLMEDKVKRQVSQLKSLRAIDRAITSSMDPRVSFHVLLTEVTEQLQVSAAALLVFDRDANMLTFEAGEGFLTEALQHTRLKPGEGLAGRAAQTRQIIQVPDLSKHEDWLALSPLLVKEGFVSYYAAPLIAKGDVQGVLEIFHRIHLNPDREWIDFLEMLAGQAAIAIDNALLFDGLNRSNADLVQAYDSTLEGWARALELRDMETEGHSQRVARMTVLLAKKMGIMGPELTEVRRGALLHDIGKMGIPDSILHKPGNLDENEWKIMKEHPRYAFSMLSKIDYLRPALDIPYCHHEKWNGTGYPRGLKAEEIPLAARVFAIVDVWDALRSDRSYRSAWTDEEALEYILEQRGEHFDPAVVDGFIELIGVSE